MLPPLRPADFSTFFREAHGHGPFPWQSRLAQSIAASTSSAWPDVMALPTGSGKTSCIDVAVFALACQADRPITARTVGRRIFFVIDRRVVVDEAFEHARRLAHHIETHEGPVTRAVRDRLRVVGGVAPEQPTIAVVQLRGGVYRDDAWAKDPARVTIVACTVDQLGSRLLFRGYGVSPRMAPIHAGLAANDALVIVDEAHCANPFRQTLTAIERFREWAQEPLPSPFDVVVMSATPPPDAGSVFGLAAEDLVHEVLRRRLEAPKPATLKQVKLSGTTGDDTFARALATCARELSGDAPVATGVVVNRVSTAKKIFVILRDETTAADVVLLTGRMRPLDRDAVVGDWLTRLDARASDQRQLERPLFVVATQTLEVGANLDFDRLVTECASLDALRQRFGRLNRAGRNIDVGAAVVIRSTDISPREPDPVYGHALSKTWRWLTNMSEDRAVDFGLSSLQPRVTAMPAAAMQELLAPAPDAPVLLPAYLDAWVQTSPRPAPDPDVALFLHGPKRGAPDVQVCWRADLLADQADSWIEAVSLCAPVSAECMPVPLWMVRQWLKGASSGDAVADVESVSEPSGEQAGSLQLPEPRLVVRWCGPDDSSVISDPERLKPGDTTVIPAQLGGWDLFGHVPHISTPADVDCGEQAVISARGKAVLRIMPQTVTRWPDLSALEPLRQYADAGEVPEDLTELRAALESASIASGMPAWLERTLRALARDRKISVTLHPVSGLVLASNHRIVQKDNNTETFTSQDDTASCTVAVPLDAHLRHVEATAQRLTDASSVTSQIGEVIAQAARWHDVGKADPRFQALLFGGNRTAARVTGALWAKSERLPADWRRRDRAHELSGYPSGARHELLSLRLLESVPTLLDSVDADLVRHLIASHHGYCRPLAPVILDNDPERVRVDVAGATFSAESTATGLERLDSGVLERFWSLTRRYGWWGLAWLEAILRLADHRASEDEERNRTVDHAADVEAIS